MSLGEGIVLFWEFIITKVGLETVKVDTKCTDPHTPCLLKLG